MPMKGAQMAKKTTTTTDTVTIKLAKEKPGEENFITASVNGKVYRIMRGQKVAVPRAVAEVIKNSERAVAEAVDYIASATAKTED